MDKKGSLYLIPVPLSDATPPREVLPSRVTEIVGKLSFFAVENLRSARRFLKSVNKEIDIDKLTFFILDEHSSTKEIPEILQPLLNGESMGVISEAGCPGIADPGSLLVVAARHAGIRTVPLVGPSSILLGLMASGFNGQNFSFVGYLPHDKDKRIARLKEMVRRIRNENQTQIFIETPYRNNRLIEELAKELPGDLELCVASELTSPEESVIVKSLANWKKSSYDYSKHPTIFLLSIEK
ncbi:MAG: SAM-dependent methyltransferase [Muribaculaceae bacterium]|nr:SAM-dependent methyltransferase [Muribaculaceae bacterium]